MWIRKIYRENNFWPFLWDTIVACYQWIMMKFCWIGVSTEAQISQNHFFLHCSLNLSRELIERGLFSLHRKINSTCFMTISDFFLLLLCSTALLRYNTCSSHHRWDRVGDEHLGTHCITEGDMMIEAHITIFCSSRLISSSHIFSLSLLFILRQQHMLLLSCRLCCAQNFFLNLTQFWR